MDVVINPDEWMSEAQKLKESTVERVNAYKAALDEAGISVSMTRIMLKVAGELGVSITTVRNNCINAGVIEKKARKGRPALCV